MNMDSHRNASHLIAVHVDDFGAQSSGGSVEQRLSGVAWLHVHL